MNMKLTTVSGVALAAALALTTATPSAEAGSLKDTAAPAPVAAWAGCYVGGHVGGAWDDDDDGDDVKFKDGKPYYHEYHWKVDNEDDDGTFIGGVHAGCNWQDRELVYGVEGDVSFGDEIDYLASLRGRIGFATDTLLVYGTAGVAFFGAEEEFSVYHEDDGMRYYYGDDSYSRDSAKIYDDDDDEVGFVIGGGIEKKLNRQFSIGLEGLYYVFDEDDDEDFVLGFDKKEDPKFSRDDDDDFFVVRARLTYHLGGREEPLPPLK